MQTLIAIPLTVLWGFFAIAHIVTFKATGNVGLLTFAIAETLIAAFFLLRTRPKTFTTNAHEWVIGVLGTFLPLLLRPTSGTPALAAELVMIFGSAILIFGVLSLNYSFAIIPALREIKTKGMYRFVRHPIYLSYLISLSSYLSANTSTENFLVVLCTFGLLIARIYFEERHLSLTPEYRAYQKRIRWRLIPFVF